MASLTDLELQILNEVSENLTTADNWSGDDELREAIGDAIDEAAMVGEYYTQKILIPLKADVMFYSLTAQNFYPLWVKSVRLIEENRFLDTESLLLFGDNAKSWMISRGSPQSYVPYAPNILIVFPCYASDGGVIEVECVGTPAHYDNEAGYVTLREELEEALIHYGKYHLLSRSAQSERMALMEYQKYLKSIGAHLNFKHHNKALARYIYSERKVG